MHFTLVWDWCLPNPLQNYRINKQTSIHFPKFSHKRCKGWYSCRSSGFGNNFYITVVAITQGLHSLLYSVCDYWKNRIIRRWAGENYIYRTECGLKTIRQIWLICIKAQALLYFKESYYVCVCVVCVHVPVHVRADGLLTLIIHLRQDLETQASQDRNNKFVFRASLVLSKFSGCSFPLLPFFPCLFA